jgi:hypothetical protein
LVRGFGVRELLRDGRIYVYSGSQPADSDVAPSGTLLATFTLAGGTYAAATRADVELTLAGASGSLDTVKVGGMTLNLLSAAVPFNTSLSQTAIDVAANINARQNYLNITAAANTPSVGDVMLYCPYWMGAGATGLSVTTTSTTLTVDIDNAGSPGTSEAGTFAGGVDAVNGLNFLETITDGAINKESTVWQGSGVVAGTAGWFRYVAGGSTVDGTDDTDIRFDGTVATSGGDLTISSTSITAGAVYTISAGVITVPTASA